MNAIREIPAELRARPQWVTWKAETRDGRQTKVPYRADGGGHASSTDPATWAGFEEALDAADWLSMDGVGYVFAADDPYCGIDLDAGLPVADRGAIITALDSYTETSVSGAGAHVILRATLTGGRHPAGFGVFDRARYFVMTGDHIRGTPTTIEERQRQLDEVLKHYLPAPEPPQRTPQPTDLDDRELLERAFAARNGDDFHRLYQGDTSRYASASEADLAFCCTAAFWTGRDPNRIDMWLRSSGLMREKWNRADYRERTIEAAIAGTTDVYTPHPPKSQPAPVEDEPAPKIVFEPLRIFLSRELPPAEALVGVARNGTNLLPRYGWVMPWGREGSGKTSVVVDLLYHAAAGINWLSYPINRPIRIVVIVNEGIPGGFQDKLAQKLEAWNGDRELVLDNLAVYASPWGEFSFRHPAMVNHARSYALDFGADYVAFDPLHTLGSSGAGRPEDTEAFKHLLRSFGLWHDLGVITAHHSNKSGMVSGDWARHADTVIHLEKDGKNPATKFTLEKARPADPLELGVPHLLEWVTETLGYRRIELPGRAQASDDAVFVKILAALAEANQALRMGELQKAVGGDAHRVQKVALERLKTGHLQDVSTRAGWYAFLPGDSPFTGSTGSAGEDAQTSMDTDDLPGETMSPGNAQ